MAIRSTTRLQCWQLPEAIYYCHGDGSDGGHVCSKYHGHMHYYQATLLEIVINCLRLFVTMAMVVMGGMCTKYRGHYQQLIGCYVGNGLRLFVVGGEHIAVTCASGLFAILRLGKLTGVRG